jgi:hypothetical protein
MCLRRTAVIFALWLGLRTNTDRLTGPWFECTAESHLSPAWCPPGFPCRALDRKDETIKPY